MKKEMTDIRTKPYMDLSKKLTNPLTKAIAELKAEADPLPAAQQVEAAGLIMHLLHQEQSIYTYKTHLKDALAHLAGNELTGYKKQMVVRSISSLYDSLNQMVIINAVDNY